jgi:hypothetical protein
VSAAIWAAIGIAVGAFAPRLVSPLLEPACDWYHRLGHDPESEGRVNQLFLKQRWDQKEVDQLCQGNLFGPMMALPPAFGLFQGVLIGGLVGALWPYGATSASRGALVGLAIGGLFASLLMAVILAIMIPTDTLKPSRSRMLQRATILAAPLFVIPVIWHCTKWLFRRPKSNLRW